MTLNNVCYHCGTPLVYGHWQVNVFRTEEFAPSKRGAEMFLCPTCGIGWEALTSNGGQRYPSFMADGHEWRGPINRGPVVQRSKDSPMTSRWIPVNERHGFAKYDDPPYYNATDHSAQVALTCACGTPHYFEKDGSDSLWVCPDCGRVYRLKSETTYTVEEHMGDGR